MYVKKPFVIIYSTTQPDELVELTELFFIDLSVTLGRTEGNSASVSFLQCFTGQELMSLESK